MRSMKDTVFETAAVLERKNLAFAIVTIISYEGIVPRRSGRLLVSEDGKISGTIGGHVIDGRAAEAAVTAIRQRKSTKTWIESRAGRIEVMIDVVNAPKKVILAGYGKVGQALAALLHTVGFALFIADTAAVDCPYAASVSVAATMKEALSAFSCDENSALIITVHDKDSILSDIRGAEKAFYIGSISSRSRVIPQKGIHVPMGLDIGGESPEELAVSVCAELMACYNMRSARTLDEVRRRLVVVRGAGDLATALIIRLTRAGYFVLSTEIAQPTQIRRNVSFAEAVYTGEQTVDGLTACLITQAKDCFSLFDEGKTAVIVDPDASVIRELHPTVVIDAILAKKNLGTERSMAPLVIALGPGFSAPEDCDAVIETARGHNLGKIIRQGRASENTGIPGVIMGYGKERVIRSSACGVFRGLKTFGDLVKKGETIAYAGGCAQYATIDGMIRGMLHDGITVTEGFKIADIDPRGKDAEYRTPSDKARAIAGAVLEVVDSYFASVN